MKTDELSAWLLHQKPAKNATTQAFFLTRERGMVQTFCAGGRSPKKQAILQPFTPLWLTLNERPYGVYVKQVEIAAPPKLLMGDNLLSGLYLNELLYHALKPEVCDTDLLDVYEVTLTAIQRAANQGMLEMALRRFERVLIEASGYQISYEYEARAHEPIRENKRYAFLPEEGFVLDDEGLIGAHILAMGADTWDDAAVLKTAKWVMRRAIDHLLDGREIKTRLLYAHSNCVFG
ncbi:MAG: DNA repair protein RecO C-terminal domain-containing protein [Legionellaceae bacterium]|nr:DNA repair protein RecO C-terminal domain-containing protein [Legionellaceae bacterium]